jgi:hypothetical protein
MNRQPCYFIVDCEQRSPEWQDARKRMFTASRVGHFVAEQKSVRLTIPEVKAILSDLGIAFKSSATKGQLVDLLPDVTPFLSYTAGRESAVKTLFANTLADRLPMDIEEPDPYDDWQMKRGRILEETALGQYEKKSGNAVERVGLCVHESLAFGCSPDGLVNDRTGGVEIKCPIKTTMTRYLIERIADPQWWPESEYGPQVHTSMATCGFDWWDFFAHHPLLPPILHRVYRDETTEAYLNGLLELGAEFAGADCALGRMWTEEFQKETA